MAKFSRAQKKRLVLDIGSSAIRLCELTHTKTGYQLTKYYQKEYSSDPALDETARRDQKVKALQELIKETKVRTRQTIFGVPGQSVFTRTRALPPVPEYKVTQIVRYEIQQQIPFSLDQIAMDYQVLDRTAAGGYEVLMAAIKVDVVDKHVEVLQQCKRIIDVVDVSPLAAYNWLKHTGEFGDQGECVALIDLGATTTDIVIERENQFRFTRPLNIGGNDITRALAAASGMTFADAEKLKRDRGFAPTGDPERDGKAGQIIGDVLQRLVGEIMRSFAYFRSLPGGGQVNRVVLCGGGACLRNIIPYLQRQLGLEVRIAQPLAGLAIAPTAQQVNERPEQACIALGLALRCCEPVKIEINLIPPRVLEAARRREQILYWTLSLATLALIMASVIPVKANENKIVLQEIDSLRRVIKAYDPVLEQGLRPGAPMPTSQLVTELRRASGEVKFLESRADILDKARAGRQFWLDQVSLINDTRPTTGRLYSSAMETTRTQQEGQAQPQGGKKGGGGGGGAKGGGLGAGLGAFSGIGGGTKDSIGEPFPGIEPRGILGGGATGLSFGGSRTSNERKGGGTGGKKGGASDEVTLPRANAILLRGFAESPAVVKGFVDEMRRAQRTIDGGLCLSVPRVYFAETSVQQVDWSVLYEATDALFTGSKNDILWNPASGTQPLYAFTCEIQFRISQECPPPGGITEEPAPETAPAPGGPPVVDQNNNPFAERKKKRDAENQ